MEIQPTEKTLWSQDKRFGIKISAEVILTALKECQRSKPLETGGILVGTYSVDHNCAVISEMTGPPDDSNHGPTLFERGNSGLKKLLQARFKVGQYYIGEWHFHPNASASPSGIDISQLQKIATSSRYNCPEPIMLIVGGNPSGSWHIRVFVKTNAGVIELHESN